MAGPGGGLALQRLEIEDAVRRVRDDGIRHAVLADQRGQRARIDAGNGDDAARLQPGIEVLRGAPIGRLGDSVLRSTQPRTPDAAARFEVSMSSSLVPTLPIWGKVKVMICPA